MENNFEKSDFCGFLPGRFLGCETDYSSSRIVLFGAPFDGTVTFRPGSRFAPQAMRTDFSGLETYSPYQDADLEDCAVRDLGDLDLPFGDTVAALNQINMFAEKILNDGKIPLMIGGEHLVTLPSLQAAAKRFPELCVVHFDAHTDLRDEYLGQKLSHANVMRRVWETLGDARIWQFGIRSGTREEFVWADKGHTMINRFSLDGLDAATRAIGSRPVYVTVDLDVLDPSVLPGTGTPEPGGVSFSQLLEALLSLYGLNLVAADIVELSPHYDASGASTAVACKLLRELAVLIARSERKK